MKLILPANIGYKINSNNKVSFNPFILTPQLNPEEYTGYIVDIANDGMV
jgi:hypothetical protein